MVAVQIRFSHLNMKEDDWTGVFWWDLGQRAMIWRVEKGKKIKDFDCQKEELDFEGRKMLWLAHTHTRAALSTGACLTVQSLVASSSVVFLIPIPCYILSLGCGPSSVRDAYTRSWRPRPRELISPLFLATSAPPISKSNSFKFFFRQTGWSTISWLVVLLLLSMLFMYS